MNYKFLKTGMALIIAMFIQSKLTAQYTLVPPAATSIDNLWVPGGSTGINTALIDVWDQTSDSKNYPLKQLGACAYDGGGGGVVVTDFLTGWQVNTAFPVFGGSGFGIVGAPDVILGNKAGSNIDFIMAVAFVNSSNNVEVDYFDIHYYSPVAFTVIFNSFNIIPMPSAGYTPLGTVHIDVVAKSSIMIPITLGVSLPFCNTFFVTYDVGGTSLPDEVWATYGNLNTYNSMVAGPQIINLNPCIPFSEESWQPDVAGIEMAVGSSTNDIACLTYTFAQGIGCPSHWLYYSEWDPSVSTCSGLSPFVLPLDGSSASCSTIPDFRHPRIDANDNYLTNSSISCQSKVVCEYYKDFPHGSLNQGVGIYSPHVPTPLALGITSNPWIDISSLPGGTWPIPSYSHHAPAVAYGQSGGNEFMVTECINAPTITPGDFFIMSPIDQYNSGTCTSPGGDVSQYPWGGPGPQYYFEVNSAYPATSSNYANSVSTPCNYVSDTSIVAWTNSGNIYYKRSGFGPATGYAYRTTPDAVPGRSSIGGCTIYPNPADGYIMVSNPSGLADRYSIKNMLGQEVLHGSLATGNQQVNMDEIIPGSYLVNFYKEDTPVGNNMFVKK